MKLKPRPSLCGVLTLCTAASAFPGELLVHARVVSVEPVRTDVRHHEQCAPRPETDNSLAELLSWDLGLDCRLVPVDEGRISGYRVSYEWDNRIMSRVMAQAPAGSSVPLRIRLD